MGSSVKSVAGLARPEHWVSTRNPNYKIFLSTGLRLLKFILPYVDLENSKNKEGSSVTKKKSTDKTGIDKTAVIVAIVGALGIIIVAYLEFGWKQSEPTPEPGPTPVIEYVGRVVDETGTRIQGAKVTLDFQGAPPVVYTDGEGIYRFRINIKGDSLPGRVWVEAARYEKYNRNVTLYFDKPTIEDIRLTSSQ